jgi:hypothetical protein
LNGRAAREVHEILIAIFESARRRARIDLPLAERGHPLEALVAAGETGLTAAAPPPPPAPALAGEGGSHR